MIKRILSLFLILMVAVGGVSCKKKKVEKPAPGQLTDADRTKLKQNAVKAYQEIVKKYPDSPYAAKAQERLNALGVVDNKKK